MFNQFLAHPISTPSASARNEVLLDLTVNSVISAVTPQPKKSGQRRRLDENSAANLPSMSSKRTKLYHTHTFIASPQPPLTPSPAPTIPVFLPAPTPSAKTSGDFRGCTVQSCPCRCHRSTSRPTRAPPRNWRAKLVLFFELLDDLGWSLSDLIFYLTRPPQ